MKRYIVILCDSVWDFYRIDTELLIVKGMMEEDLLKDVKLHKNEYENVELEDQSNEEYIVIDYYDKAKKWNRYLGNYYIIAKYDNYLLTSDNENIQVINISQIEDKIKGNLKNLEEIPNCDNINNKVNGYNAKLKLIGVVNRILFPISEDRAIFNCRIEIKDNYTLDISDTATSSIIIANTKNDIKDKILKIRGAKNVKSMIIDCSENIILDIDSNISSNLKFIDGRIPRLKDNKIVLRDIEKVGENTFKYSHIREAIFLLGTKAIPGGIFADCEELEKVEIPNTCEIIELLAFRNCIELKNIKIPNNCQRIGTEAFYRCKSLSSIQIPKNCNFIGRKAFSNCKELRKIYIEDGLRSFNIKAFIDCNNIDTIKIPQSVRKLEVEYLYDIKIKKLVIPKRLYDEHKEFMSTYKDCEIEIY